jgi:hypothetical protein
MPGGGRPLEKREAIGLLAGALIGIVITLGLQSSFSFADKEEFWAAFPVIGGLTGFVLGSLSGHRRARREAEEREQLRAVVKDRNHG